eukprot:TRINITY_DN15292_c0_g1_i16.p1 TRINITY_DN15292_c0_g1~~TRINITY_DN15292_c0_g1_i16.p1  ORF type:complete len:520 (+),score=39.75 TRINITY_DN15292_c0_g1_i16:405-1964(+)
MMCTSALHAYMSDVITVAVLLASNPLIRISPVGGIPTETSYLIELLNFWSLYSSEEYAATPGIMWQPTMLGSAGLLINCSMVMPRRAATFQKASSVGANTVKIADGSDTNSPNFALSIAAASTAKLLYFATISPTVLHSPSTYSLPPSKLSMLASSVVPSMSAMLVVVSTIGTNVGVVEIGSTVVTIASELLVGTGEGSATIATSSTGTGISAIGSTVVVVASTIGTGVVTSAIGSTVVAVVSTIGTGVASTIGTGVVTSAIGSTVVAVVSTIGTGVASTIGTGVVTSAIGSTVVAVVSTIGTGTTDSAVTATSTAGTGVAIVGTSTGTDTAVGLELTGQLSVGDGLYDVASTVVQFLDASVMLRIGVCECYFLESIMTSVGLVPAGKDAYCFLLGLFQVIGLVLERGGSSGSMMDIPDFGMTTYAGEAVLQTLLLASFFTCTDLLVNALLPPPQTVNKSVAKITKYILIKAILQTYQQQINHERWITNYRNSSERLNPPFTILSWVKLDGNYMDRKMT